MASVALGSSLLSRSIHISGNLELHEDVYSPAGILVTQNIQNRCGCWRSDAAIIANADLGVATVAPEDLSQNLRWS